MKNKKMTYLLGLLVVTVWGLIIYKIFKATSGDDEAVFTERPLVKTFLNDYAIPKDTIRLLLNYRDPFTEKKSEPVEIPINKLIHKPLVIQKVAINWSIIKYSGYINNARSKRLIAMVSINGKQLMMSEGETAEQVKLIKNLKDSIKVTYQGVSKFISLNKY